MGVALFSAGLALFGAACGGQSPSVGVQNATTTDAGAAGSSSSRTSGTGVLPCGDPVAPTLSEPTPMMLTAATWFGAPAPSACGDTPGASVTQAWVSSAQEIYLAGSFLGAADFGSGPLPYQNSDQVFVAVFAADGQPRWSRAQRGTTASMAVDAHGNVAVLSAWIGALNEVGGTGIVNSYGPDGGLRWTREIPFGSTSEHRGLATAVSEAGLLSLAVPGRLVTLDSASGEIVQAQDYGYVAPIGLGVVPGANRLLGGIGSVSYDPLRVSAFVAAVDSVGQESWRLGITSPDADGALQNLHAGAAAAMAISGTFYGQVTIGATTLLGAGGAPPSPTEVRDGAFLALVDAQGTLLWAREAYGARLGAPQSIAFDDAGRLIVAAVGVTAPATLTVTGLDCRGDRVWAQTFSGFADAQVIAASVPGTTDIVLAGSTNTRYQPTCATCCYAPRPFLVRVARDGTPSLGFQARM